MMLWAAISNRHSYQHIFLATLSCDLICDILVTLGMVYTLLRNRSLVQRYVRAKPKCHNLVYKETLVRTNTVLNLLAIYAINCGILNV